MPGKTARALCPVCQEPMPPDETECDNCGAFVIDEAVVRLSRAFGIPREKALALFEKGFRHPKQIGDRDVDDVLQHGENGLLFLCTNCGGFVAAGDPKCPRCGAEFEPEAPEETPKEKDILDLVLCPICGADNEPSWKECEICGEPLGGTEEPPGTGVPVVTTGSVPVAPPAVVPEAPDPDALALDRLDTILKELDAPTVARGELRVRPVAKRPKVAKPPVSAPIPQRSARPMPEPSTRHPSTVRAELDRRSASRPRARDASAARPGPKLVHKPVPRAVPVKRVEPRRVTFISTHAKRFPWTAPPPEFTGGLVLAAAAGLFASSALGEDVVAWGIAGLVFLLVLVVLGITLSRREARIARTDALLLAGGSLVSAAAPALHALYAPLATLGGAVLLALATWRILASPARDLLIAAAGVPLAAFGVVAAQGHGFASTPAWTLGLVAALPWPAAVVAQAVRARSSSAAHHEIAKAERDLARQDYAGSVKDFDRAIALGAKGVAGEELPWYGKGASLILLGRYDEALRAIDKALDLNPRNEVAWLNKGNALSKMGRFVDALRCFDAAIKVNPDYEVAWNNKGNTLARLGHFEEALVCYERALEIDGDYRGAWVNKGYVLTKLGRYDEATSCADRVLRLNERPRSRSA